MPKVNLCWVGGKLVDSHIVTSIQCAVVPQLLGDEGEFITRGPEQAMRQRGKTARLNWT